MEEKNTWKCPKCGYTLEAEQQAAPPETCPGCKEKCEFVNVSCYIPECGRDAGPTKAQ